MFAINHAATALVIKKKFPHAPMIWLLISVQFVEVLWVILNYLGVEITTTEPVVRWVADIHLTHMPFSHSLFMSFMFAGSAWLVISYVLKRKILGIAVAIGITSHIILDLFTHGADIALHPFGSSTEFGLGLYMIPFMGFVAETVYGIWCWWVYKGSRGLLAIILLFNLGNISFFTSAIIGPEVLLASHPTLITSIIFVQIIVTLFLVGVFSRDNQPSVATFKQASI